MAYYGLPQPNYQTPMVYQQQYPQQIQQQQIQQPQQQMQPQMQSGGFVSVRTEQEARNYPVAPGNVMTFKIEGQPYVCEKAQGFSQLEGPVFRKYKLVEEIPQTEEQQIQIVEPNTDDIWLELKSLREELETLKSKVSKPTTRKTKEVKEDE